MAAAPSLLDTDTLSEIIKGRNAHVLVKAQEYLAAYGHFRFSILTRYEILRGLKAKQATRQISLFEQRCRKSEVFPLSDEVVVRATDIYAWLHQRGQLIGDADIIIAATALVHGLALITNNVTHFRRVPGLVIESWQDSS